VLAQRVPGQGSNPAKRPVLGQEPGAKRSSPANVDHPLTPASSLRFCSSTPSSNIEQLLPVGLYPTHPLPQRADASGVVFVCTAPVPWLPRHLHLLRLGLLARRSLCTNSAHCVPHTGITTLVYQHPTQQHCPGVSHCRPHLLIRSPHTLAQHVTHAAIATRQRPSSHPPQLWHPASPHRRQLPACRATQHSKDAISPLLDPAHTSYHGPPKSRHLFATSRRRLQRCRHCCIR
jgi:hypothetical protein